MLKQKTVYFREEDLPLWGAIENKAEWLHICLNDAQRIKNTVVQMEHEVKRLSLTPTPERLERGTCKNGHLLDSRGKCLQKDCKYA